MALLGLPRVWGVGEWADSANLNLHRQHKQVSVTYVLSLQAPFWHHSKMTHPELLECLTFFSYFSFFFLAGGFNPSQRHPKTKAMTGQWGESSPKRGWQLTWTWFRTYQYLPIGSMYGIYANIGGILMVNITIYSIHGSYGLSILINVHPTLRLHNLHPPAAPVPPEIPAVPVRASSGQAANAMRPWHQTGGERSLDGRCFGMSRSYWPTGHEMPWVERCKESASHFELWWATTISTFRKGMATRKSEVTALLGSGGCWAHHPYPKNINASTSAIGQWAPGSW